MYHPLVILIGLVSALAAAWIVMTALMLVVGPRGQTVGNLASFFPKVVRLLHRLYKDPRTSRPVRVRLWVAILYNVQPINLIPDFLPVIGFADNVVVTAWALRGAVRRAGAEAVAQHWPGSPEQLALLFRVARLGPAVGKEMTEELTASG